MTAGWTPTSTPWRTTCANLEGGNRARASSPRYYVDRQQCQQECHTQRSNWAVSLAVSLHLSPSLLLRGVSLISRTSKAKVLTLVVSLSVHAHLSLLVYFRRFSYLKQGDRQGIQFGIPRLCFSFSLLDCIGGFVGPELHMLVHHPASQASRQLTSQPDKKASSQLASQPYVKTLRSPTLKKETYVNRT